DVIERGAFTKTAQESNGSLPMLWQHDTDEVIGTYPEMGENDHGLDVTGRIVLATQRGREAYALLKAGAIKAMSIGFTIPDGKADYDQESQTRHIREARLWEISLVTFPANTAAAITQVKNRQDGESLESLAEKVAAILAGLEQKWDGSAANYSDAEWAKACILDRGEGTPKERYGLPIATPATAMRATRTRVASPPRPAGSARHTAPPTRSTPRTSASPPRIGSSASTCRPAWQSTPSTTPQRFRSGTSWPGCSPPEPLLHSVTAPRTPPKRRSAP